MAKIDCSVTLNFLKEWRRYCGGRRCGYCDLSEHNECGFPACQVKDFPEKAIEIIQAWSDEHSVKTRLDDVLEKYPKVECYDDGTPTFSPCRLGYCAECIDCPLMDTDTGIVGRCWHEPLDGGATGKAVE